MNGGSKETLGDTIRDIVSSETMHKNMEFYYVNAHGKTNLSEYYVVPENTYVFYLGFSGFVKISGREDNPDLDRMLFPGGYNSDVFADEHENNNNNENNESDEEAYWRELYENFFTGKQTSYKLYPKASVYVPGDLVPQTTLSFNSDLNDVWKKGIFQLPIRPDLLDTFTRSNADKVVGQLIDLDRQGIIPPDLFEKAVFKAGKEEEWIQRKAESNDENENDNENENESVKEDLKDWFEKPEAFRSFLNDYLQSDKDNLVQPFGIPLEKGRTTISTALSKITSEKPYRFFIVTSCRTPYNVIQEDKIYFRNLKDRAQYMYPNPVNLPKAIKPQYRIARRASFAAKPFEEGCGLSTEPAMNLTGIYEFVNQLLDAQVFERYLATTHDPQIQNLLSVLQSIRNKYVIHVSDVARLLDVTTIQYTALADESVNSDTKPALQELLRLLQSAFGFFIYGLHQDKSINADHALRTAGEWLFAHSFKKPQGNLYSVTNQRNVIAANQHTYLSADQYRPFEEFNARYRVEADPTNVEFLKDIETKQPIFWKRVAAIKSRIKSADPQSAQGLIDELRALQEEYALLQPSIDMVRSLLPKYEHSYKPATKVIVQRIKATIRAYESFPLEYSALTKAISAKKGGRRTRKQKRTKRRSTRKRR